MRLGAHPTNFKGCEVYKEILSRKSNKLAHLRAKTTAKQPEKQNNPQKNLDTSNTNTNKISLSSYQYNTVPNVGTQSQKPRE